MTDLQVFADHRLVWQGKTYRCALGKGGVLSQEEKTEGDGATPTGRYPLRRVLYRKDRLAEPQTCLSVHEINKTDGWCDDPASPAYNRPVELPFEDSCEDLFRTDHIYDIIVILGHNDDPPMPGKGSAIFFHIARDGYKPTEGCVAVSRDDMLEILKEISPGTHMEISL